MNLRFFAIRVIARHLGKVSEVWADVQAIAAGPGWVKDRSVPSHHLIDTLYPILDELDAERVSPASLSDQHQSRELAEIKSSVSASGFDFAQFMLIVQTVEKLYEFVRAIRNKQPLPSMQSIEAESDT